MTPFEALKLSNLKARVAAREARLDIRGDCSTPLGILREQNRLNKKR